MLYVLLSVFAILCPDVSFADSVDSGCPLEPSMAASHDISRMAGQLAQIGIDSRQHMFLDASWGGSRETRTIPIRGESLNKIPFRLSLRQSVERKDYDRAHPYIIVEPQSHGGSISMDLVVQPKQSYFVQPYDPNQDSADRRRADDQRESVLESIRKDMEAGLLTTFFDAPRAYFRVGVQVEMGSEMVQFVNERANWNHLDFSDKEALSLADRLGLFEAVALARQKLGTDKIKVTSLGRSWAQSWGDTKGSIRFGFTPTFEVDGVDELTAVATVYHYFHQLMATRYPQAIGLEEKAADIPSAENVAQPSLLQRGWNRLSSLGNEVSVKFAARAVRSEFEKAQAAYPPKEKAIVKAFDLNTALGPVRLGGYVEYQRPNSF